MLEKLIDDFNKLADSRRKDKKISNRYDPYKQPPHVWCNEWDFQDTLKKLDEIPALKIYGKNNIAVVLGESFFLSCLPEFSKHIDTIFFVDLDNRILAHNLYMVSCLKLARTPEEFKNLLTDPANPILKLNIPIKTIQIAGKSAIRKLSEHDRVTSGVLDASLLLLTLESNVGILGNKHFLHSQARFDKCKAALEKFSFFTLEADVFDHELMMKLGAEFININAAVRILNITNLFDYEGNYPLREIYRKQEKWQYGGQVFTSLEAIIDRPEQAVIIYSVTAIEHEFRSLVSGVAFSLSEYKELMSHYAAMANVSKHNPDSMVGQWHTYADQFAEKFRLLTSNTLFGRSWIQPPAWINAFKEFLQGLHPSMQVECYLLQSSRHGQIDALVKVDVSENHCLVPLLSRYGITNRYVNDQGAVLIYDINVAHQRNKILTMINDELPATVASLGKQRSR